MQNPNPNPTVQRQTRSPSVSDESSLFADTNNLL